MGWVLAWPPGVPCPARPNTSLFTAPSIWMLLYRPLRPATLRKLSESAFRLVLTKNGFVRAKSCRLRSRVGRVSMTPAAMLAVVPDRAGENSVLASAVTTTASVTVANCIVIGTSVVSPRVTTTPDSVWGRKPFMPTSRV